MVLIQTESESFSGIPLVSFVKYFIIATVVTNISCHFFSKWRALSQNMQTWITLSVLKTTIFLHLFRGHSLFRTFACSIWLTSGRPAVPHASKTYDKIHREHFMWSSRDRNQICFDSLTLPKFSSCWNNVLPNLYPVSKLPCDRRWGSRIIILIVKQSNLPCPVHCRWIFILKFHHYYSTCESWAE